ncbi:hypothetical protein [Mesorhizobium sp. B2-4-17]|uniref:hypothetical protein n=1 Tax=Mesorhizobium sp. B2-4-17 TaxID=2589932 RepID=UPI001128D6FA|nr:hypothetical protein [Mesorhizobium sp. B2-4-17]TPK78231.1 hypothetical protein FJ548_25195 [Mesorhizobium sp. B2-4-17]
MTGNLDLSKLKPSSARDESEGDAWAMPAWEEDRIKDVMSAPLMRAIDAWNKRASERPFPPGAERGDLDDRIEEEAWLLCSHGYSVLLSYGCDRSYGSIYASDDIRPAKFAYDVYSLEELGSPWPRTSPRRFPATGGRQPGEFERARDLAEAQGGVVVLERIRPRDREYDIYGSEIEERPEHDPCVYVSGKLTPTAAYETFMRQYDDGFVIRRFLAVFEHMRKREHRNVEAITERRPADYHRLGEIAFYLGEVRSWKADRDWLLAQGKI